VQIRIIREELAGTCKPERHISTVEGPEFIVGRGGRSTLVLPGRRVSLEHARFTIGNDSLAVEDLASMSGIQVNGRVVRQRVLGVGDVVQIGEFSLFVERDEGLLALRYEVAAQRQQADVTADHLAPARLARMFVALGAVACVGVLVWGGILPFVGREQSQSAGPLTRPHHSLSGDCQSCHTTPLTFVDDHSCQECHELSRHPVSAVSAVEGRSAQEPNCTDCHREHSGGHPVIEDARLCLSCHRELSHVAPKSERRDVLSWSKHPQFSITLANATRVELGTPEAKDRSAIKLNHQVHLKPDIRGVNGFVTLQCSDCHQVASDGGRMKPVNFEEHCQSCHNLAFDDRLPDAEVPHGDPEAVFRHAYAEYAKLFLEKQESASPDTDRRRPGEGKPPPRPEISFVKSSVIEEARRAEELLYTKTACQLCHTTREKPSYGTLESRYEVEKPRLTKQFFPGASFRHRAHEQVRCQECHDGVATSTATEDVLLPKVQTCQECHGEGGEVNKVASPCIQCHSYHDSLPLPVERKKAVREEGN